MTDLDTPGPVVSLNSLVLPGKPDHPLVVALPGGKRITFTDPGDLDLEALEKMMTPFSPQALTAAVVKQRLAEWLSDDDLAALLAIKPNLGQIIALLARAQQHYGYLRAFLEASTPGEGRS